MADDRPEPQPDTQTPELAAPKPDPSVEAPAMISVSKGYDPRLPNPRRVKEQEQHPQGETAQPGSNPERPRPTEAEPDPTLEAPALTSISKGYDPRKPNPKRVREAIQHRQRSR